MEKLKEYAILSNENNIYANENDALFTVILLGEEIHRIDNLIKPLETDAIHAYEKMEKNIKDGAYHKYFLSLEKGEELELEDIIIYRQE